MGKPGNWVEAFADPARLRKHRYCFLFCSTGIAARRGKRHLYVVNIGAGDGVRAVP